MDIRKMAFIELPDTEVGYISRDAYKCSPEKVVILEELLKKFVTAEYWDPTFQAWFPYIKTYLEFGANPGLTKKYLEPLYSKRDICMVPATRWSVIFDQILKLRNTSGTEVFEGFFYDNIESFCRDQCTFFIESRKEIRRSIYTADLNIETMTSLLNLKTWQGVMAALILYRHCQVPNMVWPKQILIRLQERISEWLTTYQEAFHNVVEFLDGGSDVYPWYTKTILDIITKTWSTSLLLKGRPDVLSHDVVYSLKMEVADALVKYVNGCPAMYDEPYRDRQVWDAICSLFLTDDPDDPNLCENAFYVLCVPWSYFKRVIDILYDFYWLVKDKKLTCTLYDRKIVSYTSKGDTEDTPEEYLKSLYSRGFPAIEEGET